MQLFPQTLVGLFAELIAVLKRVRRDRWEGGSKCEINFTKPKFNTKGTPGPGKNQWTAALDETPQVYYNHCRNSYTVKTALKVLALFSQ